MTDVVSQVASFLAEQTGRTLGQEIFYYQMPDEINQCVVVQRVNSGRHVPVQIDAGSHSLRIAARAPSSNEAYALAEEMYQALLAQEDETVDDAPGFIQLSETYAQVSLYDHPQFQTQDQQGRKVFDFYALMITKS